MVAKSVLDPIFRDELLTRGLNDPEARILVEWLVDRAEAAPMRDDVERLCRRARAIGRFVQLWCHESDHGAACQLAASERFGWPLPSIPEDPCDLMEKILHWENGGRGSPPLAA